jgi:hypothetical protein
LVDKSFNLFRQTLVLQGFAGMTPDVARGVRHIWGFLDLAPFAFTVCARSARTVNAGFGGAKRRRNQLVENAARSEV